MDDDGGEVFDLWDRASQPAYVLSDADVEIVRNAVDTAGPDVKRLKLWRMAVDILMSRPNETRLYGIADRLHTVIANRQVDRRTLHIVGTRILDRLLLVLVRERQFESARDIVREVGAATNTLLLEARFGRAFLEIPREAGLLSESANAAFDAVVRTLAVDCAEVSRHKFLSSLASGLATGALTNHAPLDLDAQFEAVFTTLNSIAAELDSIESPVERWATVRAQSPVKALLTNFRTEPLAMYRTDQDRRFGAPVDEDVWAMALQEPTAADIANSVDESLLVVYPFLSAAVPGFVLIWRGNITSVSADVSGVGIEGVDRQDNYRGWSLAAYLGAGKIPDLDTQLIDDVVFIDWNSSYPRSLAHIAAGFEDQTAIATLRQADSLPAWSRQGVSLLPTARYLTRPSRNDFAMPPTDLVSFFGDASADLLGPWLENHRLNALFGDRFRSYMGTAATLQQFVEALTSSSLLIVSCHGGALGSRLMIELADGLISADRILESRPDRVPPKVILACCSGGTSDRTPSDLELYGVVTTLLTIGVEEVMAPVVPVSDLGSAAVCTLIASGIYLKMSLREASMAARQALVLHRAEGNNEFPLHIFDRGDQPTGFPFDYEQAAERCNPSIDKVVETLDSYCVYGHKPSGRARGTQANECG